MTIKTMLVVNCLFVLVASVIAPGCAQQGSTGICLPGPAAIVTSNDVYVRDPGEIRFRSPDGSEIVAPIGYNSISKQELASLSQAINDEFTSVVSTQEEPAIELVDRSSLSRILQEQRFQNAGLTDGDAVEIGRLTNARTIVLLKLLEATTNPADIVWQPISLPGGRLNSGKLESRIRISARVLDVQSGSLLFAQTGVGEARVHRSGDFGNATEKAIKNLVKSLGPKSQRYAETHSSSSTTLPTTSAPSRIGGSRER